MVEKETLQERNEEKRASAKLVRRATFGNNQELVATLSQRSWKDAVQELLNAPTGSIEVPTFENTNELVNWWVQQMGSKSGLHERMVWFWHTHLTTNKNKAGTTELVRQQLSLLRTHALGNFREMLQAFVIDGSLLIYLDGNNSVASTPNENLSRELMELFTLGAGNYTQEDVRSGARALAGWKVDTETNQVNFERKNAFIAPLLYRGVQANWDTQMIVNSLCDDPRTAAFVARKIWHYFGGGWLGEKDSVKLGEWWQKKDLEIRPLVKKVLEDTEDSYDYQRPKTGLEFFCSYASVTGMPLDDNMYRLRELKQMPYEPPNVAGWPVDNRWLESGSMLIRGWMAMNIDFENLPGWQEDTIASTLDKCGLYAVTDSTLQALKNVDKEDINDETKSQTRWRIALASPEFQLL